MSDNKIQSILITGGAGFIGSNFINLYVPARPDLKFINVDLLTYAGSLNNISSKVKRATNYQFYRDDISDNAAMDAIFAKHKPDAVIHFAAESHVDNSIRGFNPFIQTNIVGTKNLLELSRMHKVKRFHQISTDEVYGEIEDGKFTEETPVAPNNPYSFSKASADLLVHVYHHTFGLNTVISRCSNNFGPHQHDEKFIPTIIRSVLSGNKVPVYGTGMNVRDWIFVEDHCHGVWEVFWHGSTDSVYNLGADNELTNIEIVKLVLAKLGKDESWISFVADRLGHDKRYAIEPQKTKTELNWRPKHSFDQALHKTISHYIKKYHAKSVKGNAKQGVPV